MNKFIAIEGVIGVGKTTLARLLKPHFDAQVLLEVFEENPFLADFYADRERYAFQTQLFFLLSRYQQQKNAVPAALNEGNLISDYTFAKDELFAWLNLKDDELAMYGRVHSALGEKIRPPDLLVYLHASHEALMQRIALRDRPYERDMDPEYIRQLAAAYEAWLANLTDIPVLKLDMTQRDVLTREEDLHDVVEAIHSAIASNGGWTAGPGEKDQPTRRQSATGSLTNFQEFHRHLDRASGADGDLFAHALGLFEEIGRLAGAIHQIRAMALSRQKQGSEGGEALQEAILAHRTAVGEDLAGLLALVLKLANDFNLDLEQSYVAKMRDNLDQNL